MENIELKVKVNNFAETIKVLKEIKAEKTSKLIQLDTYFKTKNNARFKLREINGKNFELIYYKRPNKKGTKVSSYKVINLDKAGAGDIKIVCRELFGILTIIKKERNYWLYKNTRIFLDKVDKLGNFVELETVVKNITLKQAGIEHREVIKLLNLNRYKSYAESYSDLLLAKSLI